MSTRPLTPRLLLFGLLVVALLGYGLFEARRLLEGPSVVITSPQAGSATSTPLLRIAGIARNIAFLTINGSEAFTDEAGNFEQLLTPPSGYTVFTVAAVDRFGRHASQTVSITMLNYCPTERYA
jgi:hypothetical protein